MVRLLLHTPALTETKRRNVEMSVIKVLEIVGVSDQSWHAAVQNALDEASKTVQNITGVDVIHTTGKIQDGKIAEYHANVKFAFRVDR
jgi:flavin-binding protein dodecin